MFRRSRGQSGSLDRVSSSETQTAEHRAKRADATATLPRTGDRIELPSLETEGVVGSLLGQGGQGAVYALSVDGEDYALKWYFPRSATEQQKRNVSALVERGAPHEHFLWPTSMATPVGENDAGGFGYVMPLRPDGYVGLSQLISGRVDAPFRILTTMGLQLADGYLALHSQGLCYRDISFANVFFDPTNGEILICDTDNVGIDGASSSTVRGTPYFMAPEIVRGEALPSRNTDLWSLAVLLFYIFFVHHPLEGRRALEFECWDEEAMRDLFGARPLFIFDPDDTSNAPEVGVQDNPIVYWNLYPAYFRALFEQAFTEGLSDPVNGRVRESVWRNAMARLHDAIVYCQRCGRQNILDEDHDSLTCWSCTGTVQPPPRLRIGRRLVVLNHDAVLYPRHVNLGYTSRKPIAEVVRHPTEASVWGLRNLTDHDWSITMLEGDEGVVHPGRAATLTSSLVIDLGTVQATVII